MVAIFPSAIVPLFRSGEAYVPYLLLPLFKLLLLESEAYELHGYPSCRRVSSVGENQQLGGTVLILIIVTVLMVELRTLNHGNSAVLISLG